MIYWVQQASTHMFFQCFYCNYWHVLFRHVVGTGKHAARSVSHVLTPLQRFASVQTPMAPYWSCKLVLWAQSGSEPSHKRLMLMLSHMTVGGFEPTSGHPTANGWFQMLHASKDVISYACAMSTEWLRAAYRCFDFDLAIWTPTQPYPPIAAGNVLSLETVIALNTLKPSESPLTVRKTTQKNPRLGFTSSPNHSSTAMGNTVRPATNV